jgi:outer membrane protein TolC
MATLLTRRLMRYTPIAGMSVVLLSGAPFGSLEAQNSDPLAPFVEEALDRNLGLFQERLVEQQAAARAREARGSLLPNLSVAARYSELDGALNIGDFVNPAYAALNDLTGTSNFPTDLDVTLPFKYESRLRVTQPVFNETVRNAYSLARHRANAQAFQRRAFARRLAAEVQLAYLRLAAAESAVEIYDASYELVEENERVAESLLDAGDATPEVLFRARAERSEVAQQQAEARERAAAAARVFNQLLDRPLDTPIEMVPDSLLRFELLMSTDSAVALALAEREELAGVDAGIEAADAAVRLATADFLPAVSLSLDYGFQGQQLGFGADRDFVVASVVMTWNVFSGGRNLARRQGAQDEAQRVRTRQAELEQQIRLDVIQAYQAAVVAQAAIATAEDRLAAAGSTFELVRRRYEEGVATHIEFVDARTGLTRAELNYSVTTYRAAMRYVELERAAALRVID